MSRLPRAQEHLKTGFTTEAAAAARFRAFADAAERDGLDKLAGRWRELAAAKDRLASLQLEAADQIRTQSVAVRDAIAEESYENDVLYPRMMRDVDSDTAKVFEQVVEAQKAHAADLDRLRVDLQAAAGGDLE